MKTLSKALIVLLFSGTAVVCLQGCSKSNTTTPSTTSTTSTPANPTFTCLVDGNSFTATKITSNMYGNITIIAVDSTVSSVQEIYISLALRTGGYPSNTVGTPYSLAGPATNASQNGATYSVGPHSNSFTNYFATSFSPGTLTITSNTQAGAHNSLATGTFQFQGYSGPNYHTITNGAFANLSIND